MRYQSPYRDEHTTWYRGNLHTHTTESDGRRAPQVVIDDYAERGYDFLAISDHDMITDPERFESAGMVLLRANEVTANASHLLHIDPASLIEADPDRQKVLDAIGDDRGFAVMAHPNWKKNHDHWTREQLADHRGYIGVEVFNGVIQRLAGEAVATDRWDELLNAGRRVWGFAHDDSHEERDVAQGWLMVQARERSRRAILEAITQGRFYASTGVTIERIALDGDDLVVHAPNAQRVVVVADAGRRVHQVDASEMRFSIPRDADWQYLRVECYGRAEARAWTQPFWRK